MTTHRVEVFAGLLQSHPVAEVEQEHDNLFLEGSEDQPSVGLLSNVEVDIIWCPGGQKAQDVGLPGVCAYLCSDNVLWIIT